MTLIVGSSLAPVAETSSREPGDVVPIPTFFADASTNSASVLTVKSPAKVASPANSAFACGVRVKAVVKAGAKAADNEKAYRELLELGIVNQQLQIGDLKGLFKAAKFGDDVGNVDAVLRPMLSRIKASL